MPASNTKPPGPSTALVSPGCYAVALNDCDGGPCTNEHYITKELLARIGKLFELSGPAWLDGAAVHSHKALRARVLCKRHNQALSAVDAAIVRLFDALAAYHSGAGIGTLTLSGEDLERWVLKVWAGMLASGNMKARTGERISGALPDDLVAILFGEKSMPDGWGLNFFEKGNEPIQAGTLAIYPMTHAEDHDRTDEIYGATFIMLGCPFTVVLTRLASGYGRLWYRPSALVVGDGRIDLDWSQGTTTEPIELLVPPASKRGKS